MKRAVQIFLSVTAGIFLIWFLLPMTFNVINAGNILGVFLCLVLIFRWGFNPLFQKLKKKMLAGKFSKFLFRAVSVGLAAFTVYAVILSALMVWAMAQTPGENATAVVLGAQVKPWGPSVVLSERIDAAENYLSFDAPKACAVVSGGEGADEPMSEAECMYRSMTQNSAYDGFPGRIFMEDRATNTRENIEFSLSVIEENGLEKNIAVVTDSYHQLRARIIAKRLSPSSSVGAVNTVHGITSTALYPTYFVREWIAVPVEFLKG